MLADTVNGSSLRDLSLALKIFFFLNFKCLFFSIVHLIQSYKPDTLFFPLKHKRSSFWKLFLSFLLLTLQDGQRYSHFNGQKHHSEFIKSTVPRPHSRST